MYEEPFDIFYTKLMKTFIDTNGGLYQQWQVVFDQIWVRNLEFQNLKEALIAFQYKKPLPYLTKDVTKKFYPTYDTDFMGNPIGVIHSKLYQDEYGDNEAIVLPASIEAPDGYYYFDTKFVLCSDKTILKFD